MQVSSSRFISKTLRALAAAATLGALFAHSNAIAISEKYRQELERSGCTQFSESQGCDIHKTKAENAKAGFGNDGADAAPAASAAASAAAAAAAAPKASPTGANTPYAGQ